MRELADGVALAAAFGLVLIVVSVAVRAVIGG